MAEISKPDYTYLWSSGGAIVSPSNVKIQTGWTAEVPPFQWENWSQNRQDQAISHILQKGISVWSSTGEYYFTASGERSYVQGSDGNIYVAVADSVGQDPVTDATDTYWKLAFTSTNPVATSFLNLKATISAVSSSTTVTADEVIVAAALGGLTYKLSSYSQLINLATTGAGGMDVGSPPSNGWVALYAIYNPSTATKSILAVNSPNTFMPPIYGGANMPSGYTASALLCLLPIAASQFKICAIRNRKGTTQSASTAYSGNTSGTFSPSIATFVPANAISIFGEMTISNTSTSAMSMTVGSDPTFLFGQQNRTALVQATGDTTNYSGVVITSPQTVSLILSSSAGTPFYSLLISGWEI